MKNVVSEMLKHPLASILIIGAAGSAITRIVIAVKVTTSPSLEAAKVSEKAAKAFKKAFNAEMTKQD